MDSGKQVVRELERRLKGDADKSFQFKRVCRGQQLTIQVVDIDRYSTVVAGLEVKIAKPYQPTEQLKLDQRAVDLSGKLSYLCNQLSILELDSEHNCVQLRSGLELHEDGSQGYFELQLSLDFLSLKKYQVYERQRKQADFLLSHDILARLVNDVLDNVAAA